MSLKAIKVLAIAISKEILIAFRVNVCLLSFETTGIKQVRIVVLSYVSKWIRIGVIFLHLVVLCAIRGIRNAALAKGLLNEFIWNVFPGLADPLANLRQFHFADTATCSEGVLVGQHPLLPLLSHVIFKWLVDCNIQGLYHTCHLSWNNSDVGVQGRKRATDRC